MENGEPSVDEITATYNATPDGSPGSFTITATGEHYRNCAECSTELKNLSFEATEEICLDSFLGWGDLTIEQAGDLVRALQSGDIEPEVESDDTDVEESGGGRYEKNMITIKVDYTVTIKPPDGSEISELTFSGNVIDAHAAGEYEECC